MIIIHPPTKPLKPTKLWEIQDFVSMEATTAAAVATTKSSFSCVRCSERKVKCDRDNPCGACVKHNAECIFRAPPPPRKRRKRDVDTSDAGSHDQPANSRKHSVNSDSGATRIVSRPDAASDGTALLPTPASTISEPESGFNKTQLLQGQGRIKFVDNSLWTRVVEEFHDPNEVLEEFSSDESDVEAPDADYGFVLGTPSDLKLTPQHPSPGHIHQLWDIFLTNVEPLVKILHPPTLQPALEKAANNTSDIPKPLEALMFSIYNCAVMSSTDDTCLDTFGESRKTLLSRYTAATKVALARVKFMGTTSIIVLQALILHLIAVRDLSDPRSLWTLCGVAIRIAEILGMHRDGASLGLPPFEAEMRRRIFWVLKMFDFRTAELCGLAKFRGVSQDMASTGLPANVNDDQLYVGMKEMPEESGRPSDSIFCVLRARMVSFGALLTKRFAPQGSDAPLREDHLLVHAMEGKDEFIKMMEETLETEYLRYCDPSQPIQLMAMVVGRTSINTARFMSNHPRTWATRENVPESERHFVWETAVKLLEQYNMVQSIEMLKCFAWHGTYYMQWHAFIHILDTLRSEPLRKDADRVWKLVESIFVHHGHLLSNPKNPIYRAVGGLCLKSYDAREAELMKQGRNIPRAPKFISQLRQQRELAKAKFNARVAKARRAEDAQDTTGKVQVGGQSDQQAPLQSTLPISNSQFGQFPPVQPNWPNTQAGPSIDDDPFAFITTLDNSLTGMAPAGSMNMDMDMDFTSPSNQLWDDPSANGQQMVNWTQWDAWLTNPNLTHGNFGRGFEMPSDGAQQGM